MSQPQPNQDNNNNKKENTNTNTTTTTSPNHPIQESAPNRNPLSADEVSEKLQNVADDKDRFNRFQEQLAIKYRTEMQGYEYTPTDEFKDHPNLQPTSVEREKLNNPPKTTANAKLGETNLDSDKGDLAAQAAAQAAQQQSENDISKGQTQIGQNAGSQSQTNVETASLKKAQNAANNQQNPSESIKG